MLLSIEYSPPALCALLYCSWLPLTACTHILLYVPSDCFVVTGYCLHGCLLQGVSCCKVLPVTSGSLVRKPDLAIADLEAAREAHVNAVLPSHAKNPSVTTVAGAAHFGVYRIPRQYWGRHETQLARCTSMTCGWEQAVQIRHPGTQGSELLHEASELHENLCKGWPLHRL